MELYWAKLELSFECFMFICTTLVRPQRDDHHDMRLNLLHDPSCHVLHSTRGTGGENVWGCIANVFSRRLSLRFLLKALSDCCVVCVASLSSFATDLLGGVAFQESCSCDGSSSTCHRVPYLDDDPT